MHIFGKASTFARSINFLRMFSTNKNPYDVLGINRNASTQQIKKAFREFAQKYHPDKNPDPKAQEKFVEAKAAYQMLTDEDKRRQYDSESSANRSGYGFTKNPFDQFNDDIFKDKSRTYHSSYTAGSARSRKGQDITKQVKLSFVDAAKGCKLNISYEKKGTCQSCNGNRCKPGTAPTRCLACGGSGTTIFRQDSIVMHLQCTRCKGIGLIIKHPCPTCKATGIFTKKVDEDIDIPAGVQNNQIMTLKEKGNYSQNGPSGDLLVKIIIQNHPFLIRKGNDIMATQWLTVSQAALGSKKTIQTLWGTEQVAFPSGTQDGQKILLRNKGIKKGYENGDHVIISRIKIPTRLTEQQRKIFQQLAKEQQPIKQEEKNKFTNSQDGSSQDNVFSKFKDFFK